MISPILRLLLVSLLIVLLPACATITRGSSESYGIETKPPGADAEVVHSGGTEVCSTPCAVKVKRRGPLNITIVKEGYETVRSTIQSGIDGAGGAGMAGNVLVGGLIGAGVDAGTGAMHSHRSNPLVVELMRVDEDGEESDSVD